MYHWVGWRGGDGLVGGGGGMGGGGCVGCGAVSNGGVTVFVA